MRIAIAVLVTAAMTGAVAAQTVPTQPAWMAGCWEQVSGDKWTEECWMGPRGGIMLGAGRAGRGDKLDEWEATQIVPGPDGKLVYWGSPDGGTRVPFPMVSQSATEIVFANPAHDYPQRIRYWKDGDGLGAEIAMMDGSKAIRWAYKRTQ